MNLSLTDIAQGLRAVGDLLGRDETVSRTIQKDSRLVRPGDVFVCIEGERFDGHNFAEEAVRRGASAIIAERPLANLSETPVLMVRNTVRSLCDLARYWRGRCSAQVTGLTGTAGKTTCKEMLSDLLETRGKTARSYKNWNNELGLSLSMLAADGDETFWVMEAGISHPGEMDLLGETLIPDLAVITNIGPAHLEGLGQEENVAVEKAKLLAHLGPTGTGLVNADYPALAKEARRVLPAVKTFSTSDSSAWVLVRYQGASGPGGRYFFSLDGEGFEEDLPFRGRYMAENLAAVAGASICLGLSLEDLQRGLASLRVPEQRFQIRRIGEFTLIDDTYNANPLSMLRAIQTASEMESSGELVLILGDMAELGEQAVRAHEEMGAFIAGTGCRHLFFKGTHQDDVFRGLQEKGWKGRFVSVESPGGAVDAWRGLNLERGTVLFKGSRCCQMEELYRAVSGDIQA